MDRDKRIERYCWITGIVSTVALSTVGALPWLVPDLLPTDMFPPPAELPLGAEYFGIARSIANGDGFSSPFRVPSGPTAWMPPALPVILSGLYLLSGKNDFATAILFHLLSTGCVIASFRLILNMSGRFGLSPIAAAFGFLACLYSQWRDVFAATHDGAVLLLVATLLLYFGIRFHYDSVVRSSWGDIAWGVMGGISSLLSPALLLSWIGCSVLGPNRTVIRLLKVGSIALAIQSPWLIRNYACFGSIVPVKTNAQFEFAFARSTEDGLLNPASFQNHPYLDEEQAQRHAELGEIAYVSIRSKELRETATASPSYWQQVANRAIAYSFVYTSWNSSTLQKVLFACPSFLMGIMLVCWTGNRLAAALILTTLVAYGLPYILVSYYERYSVPMIPIRGCGMAMGLQSIYAWVSEAWQSPTRKNRRRS